MTAKRGCEKCAAAEARAESLEAALAAATESMEILRGQKHATEARMGDLTKVLRLLLEHTESDSTCLLCARTLYDDGTGHDEDYCVVPHCCAALTDAPAQADVLLECAELLGNTLLETYTDTTKPKGPPGCEALEEVLSMLREEGEPHGDYAADVLDRARTTLASLTPTGEAEVSS